MANTTRTQIAREVNNFYDKTLLHRAIPLFLHNLFAQVRDLPRKAGTRTIKFRKYSNLSAATTALTEGVTPAGSQLSVTDITAVVLQYGDYVTLTDVVSYETPDAILTETAEILGDQAGDTLDQLTRDVIVAGTNVYYGGTATSRVTVAAGDKITEALVKNVVNLMKNNKAKKMTSMINPSTGYNTTPLNSCYVGIVHPDISATLKYLTNFIPIEKYPKQQNIMPGEIGSLHEVRFIETTNAKVFSAAGAGSIDVYAVLFLAMHAYGITRISGEAMKNIIKPLGSAGTADPLDQRQTSGWKATHIAKILNNDYIVRVEVAAS